MTQPLHSPLGGIALNAIRWRSGEPDIGYAILRDDVRWLLRYIAEAEAAAPQRTWTGWDVPEAAAPDPVATPLDVERLARALTAYGGAGGRVRLVIPMKAKAVHEAAQSLARLYEYARLEGQP